MTEETIHAWKGVYPAAPEAPDAEERDPLFVRAAARTMQVLSAFHGAEGPLSLTDMSKAAGLDRSTTQRIIHTLRKLGYIQRDDRDTGYVPGIRLYDHIFDTMRLNGLIQRAIPVLLQLRDTVGERVDLSLIDDTRLVYATRFQPKRDTLYAMMLGHSVPIYCTSAGWAVLAQLDEAGARDILERSERVKYTEHTLIDPDAIIGKTRKLKQQGYAVAIEQLMPGEIAIGAAITNPQGKAIGAVTITAMLSDWSEADFVRTMRPALVQAANMLGRG
jgi:DNA-binding IclR family transcriptional regulator